MKTGTLRQIEEWASEGRQKVECGRNAGKLSDNVTEERLLRARILELSKERYKFLSQVDYEKRIFLDRQLRKRELFTEIMKTVDIKKSDSKSKEMRRAIERRESIKSFSKETPSKSNETTSQMSSRQDIIQRTRSALTERASGWSSSADNTLSVGVSSSDMTFERNFTEKAQSGLFQTEPTYPIRPRRQVWDTLPTVRDDGSKDFTEQKSFCRTASTPSMRRKISFAVDQNPRNLKSSKSWHGVRDKPDIPTSPIDDDRYQLLARCLSANWSREETLSLPEVKEVIRNNKSLHTPSKNNVKRKANVSVKFQKLLSDQGLVF